MNNKADTWTNTCLSVYAHANLPVIFLYMVEKTINSVLMLLFNYREWVKKFTLKETFSWRD